MKKRMVLAFVLVLVLEPWIVSLIHCEVLTAKYVDADMIEAISAYEKMTGEIDTLKILEYKPYSYCKLYAKSDECGNEFILMYDFEDAHLDWNVVYWDSLWVKHGNGNELVWPYIR